MSLTDGGCGVRFLQGEDAVEVHPGTRMEGTVRVPGDKSISHRLAMLGGLASGRTTVRSFLCSEDCLSTLAAVEALGAMVTREGTTVRIDGTAGRYREPGGSLDLGNSGTGMRLLSGLLAAHPFRSRLTGDASLCSRPMGRVQVPLERMGGKVEPLGKDGRPPLDIRGGELKAIDYELPVASAQVKSCVLLAGLFASGRTTVREPKPTRDHTERLLRAMGLRAGVDGPLAWVEGSGGAPLSLPARDWDIPGDLSSAAFWIVAAACGAAGAVVVEDVGLNPRRSALLAVLHDMGAGIEIDVRQSEAGYSFSGSEWEPRGNVTVGKGRLHGVTVGGYIIPNLIDELPLVAVAGALAEGETEIRDAAELRVKESDRIATMATAMRTMGADVEERPDGMRIRGGRPIVGDTVVESGGDHRVAMALAVLGLFAERPTILRGVQCIGTSYPSFWDDWGRLMTTGA